MESVSGYGGATLPFVCLVFTIVPVMDETHFRALHIGSGRREQGMIDARFKRVGGCDSIKSGGCCVLYFLRARGRSLPCAKRQPDIPSQQLSFKSLCFRTHATACNIATTNRRTITIAFVYFLPSLRASVTALARFAQPYRAISGAECHHGPRNPHTKGPTQPPPPTGSSSQARGSQSARVTATLTAILTSQMATPTLPTLLPLPSPQ
jgi:hypothetical protein